MPRPPWKHMMPNDVPLFASFVLGEQGQLYTRWEFDVTLGPGLGRDIPTDPALRTMSDYLNKLKADAVGWIGSVPTIFEAKPEAGLSALGQILGYNYYYQIEKGIRAYRAVITDFTTANLTGLFEAFGVDLYLVHPASLAQIAQAQAIVSKLQF